MLFTIAKEPGFQTHKIPRYRARGNITSAPLANILSERAALLAEVAGAVAAVEEEEPDDVLGLEEEPVEVPGVTEPGDGIDELPTEADVLEAGAADVLEGGATDVLEAVATDVPEGATEDESGIPVVMGPGPRLNRRTVSKRISIVNGPTGSDLRRQS